MTLWVLFMGNGQNAIQRGGVPPDIQTPDQTMQISRLRGQLVMAAKRIGV
jgi:hypothetical protein